MADNIVGGLFGMTPELLQAQRNAQLEQQAANFVNNYGDQGAMFGYKLGSTLGRGIGGMLGAQDPEMMRIKQRQQMLQGLDINDPQSLMKAAQEANQRGDTPAAQELYAKANALAKSQADIAETQAKTQKALRETDPEKVRIARSIANNVAEPNTAEWKAAFTEALNTQITPRGLATPVSIQDQQLIGSLEEAISTGKPVDAKTLNQARFVLGKLMQPKTIIDPQTGEAVQVPGANVNQLAPNLAAQLFGGGAAGQPPMAGQPQGAPSQPAPYGVTSLSTPKSEAIKAKELENVKASVSSLDTDLSNVDEAIKRTTPFATGWGAYVLENLPNTEAMALKDIVTSLNAAKVFTELGKLKEQSRTGASGLGSVTEKEIGLLESRIRTLNPKSKTFPSDLDYIKTKWKDLRDKMQLKAQGQSPTASLGTTPKSDEDIINRAMAHPSAKGYTKEQIIAGLRKAGKIQ